jgi:hypothetical protein
MQSRRLRAPFSTHQAGKLEKDHVRAAEPLGPHGSRRKRLIGAPIGVGSGRQGLASGGLCSSTFGLACALRASARSSFAAKERLK